MNSGSCFRERLKTGNMIGGWKVGSDSITFRIICVCTCLTMTCHSVCSFKIQEPDCADTLKCLNGGTLKVPDSMWDRCPRCRCPPGYLGPLCQYKRHHIKGAEEVQHNQKRKPHRERIDSKLKERIDISIAESDRRTHGGQTKQNHKVRHIYARINGMITKLLAKISSRNKSIRMLEGVIEDVLMTEVE